MDYIIVCYYNLCQNTPIDNISTAWKADLQLQGIHTKHYSQVPWLIW